jgi:adenylosuccinate lyase
LLLDLAEAGMLRETAYRLVQAHAMQCWESGTSFKTAVAADPEVTKYLSAEKLDETFSAGRQLRNIDKLFARVFA